MGTGHDNWKIDWQPHSGTYSLTNFVAVGANEGDVLVEVEDAKTCVRAQQAMAVRTAGAAAQSSRWK